MANWLMRVIDAGGYGAIALLMFLENVFPPLPSELIMPLVGYMAGRGQFSLIGVVAAGTIGSVVGVLPLYYLGQKLDEERLKEMADRHGRWLTISRRDIERAHYWFDKHGWAAVFFCRLVPGVRSLISLPAGVAQMRLSVFLTCTVAGAAIWALLLAGLGYLLGGSYEKVETYLNPASYIVLGVVVMVYVLRVLRHKGGQD